MGLKNGVSPKKVRKHPHKTKKRLAAKAEMLASRTVKKGKKK